MDQPSHIIDPDGEVIILLRKKTLSKNGKRFGKKKKKNKKRSVSSLAPVHTPLEPTQPPTEDPGVVEEPTVEEPAVEEPAVEEPAVEEPAVEEPAVEEPAVEEPAVEEPVREQIKTDLVREPLDETFYRIQVSAKHLILASPVFKKTLTGGWKESVTYLQKGSVEITAESWDIEALLILLRAIHGQQYHVPRKLTLEMLAKVAVLVDYYDCKEAVYIWSTIWIDALEEKIPKTYSRDLLLWLWISCVFQLPAQFKESTSTVMSWSDGWITSLEFPIPFKVMEAMNKHREEAINNLVILLHDTREALLSGNRGCGFECSSIMYGALTKEMRSSSLFLPRPEAPFSGLIYKDLVSKVLSFTMPRWATPNAAYRSSYHVCSDSSFKELFGMLLSDTIQGLDLHDLIS